MICLSHYCLILFSEGGGVISKNGILFVTLSAGEFKELLESVESDNRCIVYPSIYGLWYLQTFLLITSVYYSQYYWYKYLTCLKKKEAYCTAKFGFISMNYIAIQFCHWFKALGCCLPVHCT